MKAIAYSIKNCEKELLVLANEKKHDITFISDRLTEETVSYSKGKDAVLVFSSDDLSEPIIKDLKKIGVKYIVTRSTGMDHIDLAEAEASNIEVENIPSYSPESIAEHAITLILALYRNILPAHQQMLEYDFSLDNLVGSTLSEKTVGIVGYGKTAQALVRILKGFGCRIVVAELDNVRKECREAGAEQVEFEELIKISDIISFHVPLTAQTRHMVNAETIDKMKDGVMLINVSRGAIFNSIDVYNALQRDKISKLGMDVYEFENQVFFFDRSHDMIDDQLLKSFIQHSRVLLTPHQAFLTREALEVIAARTIQHLDKWGLIQSGKAIEEIIIRSPDPSSLATQVS